MLVFLRRRFQKAEDMFEVSLLHSYSLLLNVVSTRQINLSLLAVAVSEEKLTAEVEKVCWDSL